MNATLRTIDWELRTLNVLLRYSGGDHASSYDMWHAEKSDDDIDEPTTRQRYNNFRRWFTPLNHSHIPFGYPLTCYE